MRYFLIGLLLITLGTGCHKKSKSTTDGTSPVENFEPTKQYDVKFKADNQKVVVANFQNQDTVLSMTYYQKVALIVRQLDYNQSWTIFFNQTYAKTALDGVLFQAFNTNGDITYKWIETNLNNIVLQSKSDTVINGTNYYNLKVGRVITFLQAYPTKAKADSATAALLQRKNDAVAFTTYYSYSGLTSVPVTGTANLVYTKP